MSQALAGDDVHIFLVGEVADFTDLLALRVVDADLRSDVSLEVVLDGRDLT
jgi:hypothetical protein